MTDGESLTGLKQKTIWSNGYFKQTLLEAVRRMDMRRPLRRAQRESMAEGSGMEHCVGNTIIGTRHLIIHGSRKGEVSKELAQASISESGPVETSLTQGIHENQFSEDEFTL